MRAAEERRLGIGIFTYSTKPRGGVTHALDLPSLALTNADRTRRARERGDRRVRPAADRGIRRVLRAKRRTVRHLPRARRDQREHPRDAQAHLAAYRYAENPAKEFDHAGDAVHRALAG